ncbi:sugar transporter [Elizabethkingia argentiflava]|uniref:Sugar transporter n=2 Tax=Elizabethkingia argenteiflava TaxID=2681556 RepID=A0A845PSX2_9FLAO|nr:sugar transporter [Elizabethkingia argenteiflava]
MTVDAEYPIADPPALRIQKNDRLNIQVSAKSLELAAPFNVVAGAYKLTEDGVSTTSVDKSGTSPGYLIDQNGNIEFPVLGILHVEGLTLNEVRDLIRNRLIKNRYISDPVVKVEMLNFKITVMGAVKSESVLTVPDGRMSLLEALTKVGGLSTNASPDRITVIREENGVRRRIVTNIQTQEVFNSPAYYLQQNDIVYVEPRTADISPKEDRFWKYFGIGMGFIGFLMSTIAVIK